MKKTNWNICSFIVGYSAVLWASLLFSMVCNAASLEKSGAAGEDDPGDDFHQCRGVTTLSSEISLISEERRAYRILWTVSPVDTECGQWTVNICCRPDCSLSSIEHVILLPDDAIILNRNSEHGVFSFIWEMPEEMAEDCDVSVLIWAGRRLAP